MQNPELNPEHVWHDLASRYTASEQTIFNRWRELLELYYSPGRYYHTLDHIRELLQLAYRHRQSFTRFDEILFAIFYHDAVYNVNGSGNEEKSARMAVVALESLNLTSKQLDFIAEAILATQKHEQHSDPDINLLLDLDLAILGAEWPVYEQYSRQIRQEYSIYPDLLYKPGRKRVLQNLLKQPRLYKTEYFYKHLEEAARRNLQRELSFL